MNKTHTDTHMQKPHHTRLPTYTHTHMNTHRHTTHSWLHAHINTCTNAHTHAQKSMRSFKRIHQHTHANAHNCTLAHTHTHTHTLKDGISHHENKTHTDTHIQTPHHTLATGKLSGPGNPREQPSQQENMGISGVRAPENARCSDDGMDGAYARRGTAY